MTDIIQDSPSGRRSPRNDVRSPRNNSPSGHDTTDGADDADTSNDLQPLIGEEEPPAYKPMLENSDKGPIEEIKSENGNRPLCCVRRLVHSNWCSVGLTILMVLSVILFLFLHFFVITIMQDRVMDALTLRNATSQKWANPKADVFLHCYIFNITNADKISAEGGHVAVREMGPYVYRISVDRTDITWNKNGTVSYREVFNFHFDPERSPSTEDDLITTVDDPVVALRVQAGSAMSGLIEKFLGLEEYKIFRQLTVRELMWGYESELLAKLVAKLKSWNKFGIFESTIAKMPTRFGYFSEVNGTASPLKNVYTGASDFCKFNQVYSWDYLKRLPFWFSKLANTIRGTDGSMFQPFITSDTQLTFFCAELFRAFDLEYQKSVSLKGIGLERYIIPDSQFTNTTMDANDIAPSIENRDCQIAMQDVDTPKKSRDDGNVDPEDYALEEAEDDDTTEEDEEEDDFHSEGGGFCNPKCVPNGMYSLETVTHTHGMPIFVSMPHLLGADPVYFKNIDGLAPTEWKHRPWFDVDGVTGAVVSQRRRYQLNVKLPESRGLGTFVPIFWVDTASQVLDEDAANIKMGHMIYRAIQSLRFFMLGLAILSWVFIIGIIVARTFCGKK